MKNVKRLLVLLGIVIGLCLIPSISNAEEVEVATYSEAKTAVSEGKDIKLIDHITANTNFTIGQPVTIDLNGKTLDMKAKTMVVVSDATIKDSLGGGKVTGNASFVVQIGSTNLTGDLTLESGEIACTGAYGVRVLGGTSLTINGGKISGKKFVVYNQGTCTMNGGNIYAETGIAFQNYTNSTLIMNDGTIETIADYQALNLYGNCSATINGGQIIAMKEGTDYCGNGISAFKNTTLTVNGGTIKSYGNAILGNGSGPESGSADGTGAKFYINGGTIECSYGAGIYAPQLQGETVITGGTITGDYSGIEIRAGKLTISGGTINGDLDRFETERNTNGASTIGSAVAVVQHTSKQPIEVIITGGTFNGYVPFSESNSLQNAQEYVDQISYDISGGVFNSTGDRTVQVEDMAFGKFISGGKFTHKVTSYVKDGYGEKPEDNMDAVYPLRTVTLSNTPNGTVTMIRKKVVSDDGNNIVTEDEEATSNVINVLHGDEIYLIVDENDGYIVFDVKGINGTAVKTTNGYKFECLDDNIVINMKYAKILVNEIDLSKNVNEIDVGITDEEKVDAVLIKATRENNELSEAIANIDPTIELIIEEIELSSEERKQILSETGLDDATLVKLYNIYIVVKDENGNELGRIHELPEEIELAVKLPGGIANGKNGYTRVFKVVRQHDSYEIIDSETEDDGTSIIFKSDKFSTYAVAYIDEKDTEESDVIEETSKIIKTGDQIIAYTTVFAIGVLGIMILKKPSKKASKKAKH